MAVRVALTKRNEEGSEPLSSEVGVEDSKAENPMSTINAAARAIRGLSESAK